MKKTMIILLSVLLFCMTIDASWFREQGAINLFSDTIIGVVDSTEVKGSYRSNQFFYPKNIRIAAFVDSIGAKDSCDIDVEIQFKNNSIGKWTDYDLLGTITASEMNKVRVYALADSAKSEMVGFDSLRVLIQGDASNDKSAGVFAKVWILWSDDGY